MKATRIIGKFIAWQIAGFIQEALERVIVDGVTQVAKKVSGKKKKAGKKKK